MGTSKIKRVAGIAAGGEATELAAHDNMLMKAAMHNSGLTRDMVVLSVEHEHNAEVYELDHFHTKGWTPGMMVAACRENVWGASVDGCRVRVFTD